MSKNTTPEAIIADVIAAFPASDGFTTKADTDHRGNAFGVITKGSRVVSVRDTGDGSLWVAMSFDYGNDGTAFHDGAHLKSRAGIVKRVKGFFRV